MRSNASVPAAAHPRAPLTVALTWYGGDVCLVGAPLLLRLRIVLGLQQEVGRVERRLLQRQSADTQQEVAQLLDQQVVVALVRQVGVVVVTDLPEPAG